MEKQEILSSPPNAPARMGEEFSFVILSGTVNERRSYHSCSVGGKHSLVTVHGNHLQLCHPWGTFPDKDNESQRSISLPQGRCSCLSRGKPGSLHSAASWGEDSDLRFPSMVLWKEHCLHPSMSSIPCRDGDEAQELWKGHGTVVPPEGRG